ncbi:hypothetical protein H696_04405 [Fonticula alba]|uniref:Kinetochore protein Spc24 n=1 Tax=Fonticula alba TaxID=691883 RepID=A0A058Z425_FONAL|nr:hypothetical protein H696_04405 [Fonticula alba]KCV68985.1 hypothetical protein H696_04405 [Fonticula alba]|eukprot:XP_009496556.1 hypothetical protein H696_04405 [Fonticula alba]
MEDYTSYANVLKEAVAVISEASLERELAAQVHSKLAGQARARAALEANLRGHVDEANRRIELLAQEVDQRRDEAEKTRQDAESRLETLTRQIEETEQLCQASEDRIRDLTAELARVRAEKRAAMSASRDSDPRLRYSLMLYESILDIRWDSVPDGDDVLSDDDEDPGLGPGSGPESELSLRRRNRAGKARTSVLSGHISLKGRVRPFSVDTAQQSAHFVTNYLWDLAG